MISSLVRNPGSTARSREKLVSIRPAPISSTKASDTCATTIALRAPVRAVPVRPPSFKSRLSSGFDACMAGASPNRMPTPSVATKVNSITRQSRLTSSSLGRFSGARRTRTLSIHAATRR
ncbi:MAG: hypothetical protein ABI665_00265, partial [Vicinamibacterales bacterium]